MTRTGEKAPADGKQQTAVREKPHEKENLCLTIQQIVILYITLLLRL